MNQEVNEIRVTHEVLKHGSVVDEGVEHVVLHRLEALLHGAAVEPAARLGLLDSNLTSGKLWGIVRRSSIESFAKVLDLRL